MQKAKKFEKWLASELLGGRRIAGSGRLKEDPGDVCTRIALLEAKDRPTSAYYLPEHTWDTHAEHAESRGLIPAFAVRVPDVNNKLQIMACTLEPDWFEMGGDRLMSITNALERVTIPFNATRLELVEASNGYTISIWGQRFAVTPWSAFREKHNRTTTELLLAEKKLR